MIDSGVPGCIHRYSSYDGQNSQAEIAKHPGLGVLLLGDLL
jgi:hypothetical protein